jgi:hypothetical protein
MRNIVIGVCAVLVLACSAFGQQPPAPAATDKPAAAQPSANATAQQKLSELLESKIRASWAAFKSKNKQAYGDFLADDFMAVEEDGQGERTKMRVLREVGDNVVYDYKLQLFRLDPIGPEAALVTYENVIQFPPGAGIRFEKIFISEIWVKRNGHWKSWRYQATKVK